MARMNLYIREANSEALKSLVSKHGFTTVGCFLNDLVEKEAKGEAILLFLDGYEAKCMKNSLDKLKKPLRSVLQRWFLTFCERNDCAPIEPKKVQIEMTEEQWAIASKILSLG